MRLILCERQGLAEPEVTVAYREMTTSVQRVSDYVRYVDQTILCKKDNEECGVLINDIFYLESVDKKVFVYCEKEVYGTGKAFDQGNTCMEAIINYMS